MNEIFKEIVNQTVAGNTTGNYIWFAGLVLAGFLLKRPASKSFSFILYRIIKKYSKGVGRDRLFILIKTPVEICVLLLAFYFAFERLKFPTEWEIAPREYPGIRMFIYRSFYLVLSASFTWILLRMADYFGLSLIHKVSQSGSRSNEQLVYFLRETVKVLIVLLSLFFILGSVFKLNIASLIAGLGIGGLAIALAAKESIENLLGSFTIFFDKPFVAGDYIKTGNIEGKIEKIGFRSTRIQTPEKSFVTVPNKKLVEAALDNLSLREEQKVLINLSLDFKTPAEKLTLILSDVKKVLDRHPMLNTAENSITLYDLGPNSFHIQVLYFVKGNNNETCLSTRQEINLAILEIVNKNQGVFFTP